MKLPKRQPKQKSVEVLLAQVGQNEFLAFGPKEAINRIGDVVGSATGPFVRSIQSVIANSGGLAQSAQAASGSVLHLTAESKALLAKYPLVEKGGVVIGTVRDEGGKFAGQLTFKSPSAALATTMPVLIGGLVLQQQLRILEQKLDRIQLTIDYLVSALHIEVQAELAAVLTMLDNAYQDVLTEGWLSEDQWATVADLELQIRTLHNRATAHLGAITSTLSSPDAGIGQRTTDLEQVLQVQHVEQWLKVGLLAERAMNEWEYLGLLRSVETNPRKAEKTLIDAVVNQAERHDTRSEHFAAIAAYLPNDTERSLSEWLRFLKRKKLRLLVEELDKVLKGHQEPTENPGHWQPVGDLASSDHINVSSSHEKARLA